jgi:nicotinamidase/pyrazinamidase
MVNTLHPNKGDALIIVDMQNDFLPGGNLAVKEGDVIVPILNDYITVFLQHNLPIYATRDWHTPDHCSFQAQGGPWPPHCIAGSLGADFAPGLRLPDAEKFTIISKGTHSDKDAYSGFEDTYLAEILQKEGVNRVFIGGLATDYCVLNTVRDALQLGFTVLLLEDAIRAVNLQSGDGAKAVAEMREQGAIPTHLAEVA